MTKRNAPKKRKKSGKKQGNGLFWLTFILVAIAAWVAIFVVGLFLTLLRLEPGDSPFSWAAYATSPRRLCPSRSLFLAAL
jgi:hypothetical protein